MTTFTRDSAQPGLDNDALVADARRERDEAIAKLLRGFGHGVATLWAKGVVGPFQRWQERERTYRELAMLNEHELQDIGITSGMIPHVVSGKINPANENDRSKAA